MRGGRDRRVEEGLLEGDSTVLQQICTECYE